MRLAESGLNILLGIPHGRSIHGNGSDLRYSVSAGPDKLGTYGSAESSDPDDSTFAHVGSAEIEFLS